MDVTRAWGEGSAKKAGPREGGEAALGYRHGLRLEGTDTPKRVHLLDYLHLVLPADEADLD